MKAERKRLSLSIEFNDRNGLKETLSYFLKQIENHRTNYERVSYNGSFLQWDISKTEFSNYRVEKINGIECIVIPSKMNDHE